MGNQINIKDMKHFKDYLKMVKESVGEPNYNSTLLYQGTITDVNTSNSTFICDNKIFNFTPNMLTIVSRNVNRLVKFNYDKFNNAFRLKRIEETPELFDNIKIEKKFDRLEFRNKLNNKLECSYKDGTFKSPSGTFAVKLSQFLNRNKIPYNIKSEENGDIKYVLFPIDTDKFLKKIGY